jgi:hypothetical protein
LHVLWTEGKAQRGAAPGQRMRRPSDDHRRFRSNRAGAQRWSVLPPSAKLSCERITTKWRRARRAAMVRQTARQLQRVVDIELW